MEKKNIYKKMEPNKGKIDVKGIYTIMGKSLQMNDTYTSSILDTS